jgi:hypothetical protein
MEICSSSPISSVGWRQAAAHIVEELFAQLPSRAWDDLLELRAGLLRDDSLERTLDLFLVCRNGYEADAYLPFYRLRTLLAGSLSLQGRGVFQNLPLPPLELLLRQKHKSVAEWKRQLEREWFEQGLDVSRLRASPVGLVEQA